MKSIRQFVLVFFLVNATIPMSISARLPEYDLIIRNGRVIDGSGTPAFQADVAIKDDRIARIGNLRGASAKHVIDAHGHYTTVPPGLPCTGL